jgi:hypothetical protein
MRVLLDIVSPLLGDAVSWMPYCEEYRKLSGQDVTVLMREEKFWWMFENEYPEITLIADERGRESEFNEIKKLGLGAEFGDNPTYNMQKCASSALGLPHRDLTGSITVPEGDPPTKDKYVVISTCGSRLLKNWHYPGGWDRVVEHVQNRGYKVVNIDIFPVRSYDGVHVPTPKADFNKNNQQPLQDRVVDIANCEFFIGVGSGMAWVAHALEKPVVLISGFSDPSTEFVSNIERVFSNRGCHSCFNHVDLPRKRFSINPESEPSQTYIGCDRLTKYEQFECSKMITPNMVIDSCDRIIERVKDYV